MTTLGMFVKAPEPGRVKTRLAAVIGDANAAELYRAFLTDLIERFRQTGDRRVLAYSPADDMTREFFRQLAGGDYDLWPQPDADLGTRMQTFFETFGPEPVVLIGSDSPTLPDESPAAAFELLERTDVVLGPATDGGLYLIGLNQRRRTWPIFNRIDWSTSRVLQQVLQRLLQEHALVEVLPPWYDIDEPADLDVLRGHLLAFRLSQGEHSSDSPATRAALELLPELDVLAGEG
ncbi:MAG: glycosyltransferase [Planctomycetota bacterium]|nr:MAG: glycosyltransferase [Planctomycetota bacterium]